MQTSQQDHRAIHDQKLLTCLTFSRFLIPSHAEQLTAPPNLSFSPALQHPCPAAGYLPTGSPVHFLSFLFSVLYHRELTPAKHIPRLPFWPVGASNGSWACRRKIKIRGLPLPRPLISATGSFPTVCVFWMVPVPSQQTWPRFSCHLAASEALLLPGTSASLYLSSPGSQSGCLEVLISELLHLLPFVLSTPAGPLKLLLFIKFSPSTTLE